MKNFKRILAFVMVICTVAAWMIPGVSADEPENKDLVVNTTNDFKALGITSTTNLTAATINAAYDAGTIQWGIHATDTKQLRSRAMSGEVWLEHRQYATGYDHSTFAIKFKAPGDGKYTVSIDNRYYYKETPFDSADIFIIESPEVPLTGNNGTLRKLVSEKRAAGDAILTHGSGSKTFTSEKTVSLTGGKEYLLIVAALGPTDTVFIGYINGFALRYQAPLDVYDYTVNYHANYAGAEDLTAADTQPSTKVSAEMAVSEALFNPTGYLFMGWATEAEGAVVYQPGDEITLTSDEPTLDLYAVWLAQSEDSFALDFQTLNTDLGVTKKDDTSGNIILNYSGTTANGALIENAYIAGTYNWYPYSLQNNYGSYVRHTEYGLKIATQRQAIGSINRGGVLLMMRAPESGKFTVSADILTRNGESVADSVEIHIMPRPNYDFRLKENRYSLQNLISGRTAFPDADGNLVTLNEEDAIINTTVQSDSFDVKKAKGGEVLLEAGKEYIILIALCESDASLTAGGHTSTTAEIMKMSFAPVVPEASIGSNSYMTVEEAVDAAAVSGGTIVLKQNADVAELDLANGVTLDLNGKTLAVSGAVAGTIADSADGAGLLAASKEAVVTTPNGQVALWDNTGDAEGYRVFGYTFKSLDTTGVNNKDLSINFADDYKKFFTKSTIILNGYTKYAPGETVNAAYEEGTIDWGIGAGHRMGIGNVELMSNGLKIAGRTLGPSNAANRLGAFGLEIHSPGSGYYKPSVRYVARPGQDVAEDLAMYIIPMPVVEWVVNANGLNEMTNGYAFNSLFQTDPPSAFGIEATKVLATAVRDTTLFETQPGVASPNDVRTAVGESYYFQEGVDYMVILVVDSEVHATPTAEVLSMSFNCVQSDTSFWSYMEFENDAAYPLVAASDLKAGFKVSTDGSYFKPFELDATTMAAWAEAEITDTEADYGFYICVRGFESLLEDTTVTCIPYIATANQTFEAEAKTFEYIVK